MIPDPGARRGESGEVESGDVGQVIDTRGLRCPAPVIELARAARADGAARVLTIWWTDPAARTDIGAWARMRGHEVLGTEPLPAPAKHDEAATPESPTSDAPAYATRVRLTPQ